MVFWLLWAAGPCAGASEELETQAELDPFALRIGSYFLDSTTNARVDGVGGNIGTRLDFEEDLNLDKRKETLLAAARWRFSDRHFLEIEYFDLTRFGTKRIDKEIQFRGDVFPIGVDVSSSFTTEVTRLGYAYRVVKRPDWGLALSIGLHVTRLRTSLDAVVFDNSGIPELQKEIASVSAPLPVLGFSAARRLGENWNIIGKAQWFYLEYDNIEGALSHATAYFEYTPFRNIGFGFGYDWFDVDVDALESNWRGSANVRFGGPLAFIQVSF